jgi:SAM-dependent methyltransferase
MGRRESIKFQADHHPIVFAGSFLSSEDYVLHLIHLKAYEEAARLSVGKFVLDIGCNNGYGTSLISRSCARAVGLDVSTNAIEDAKARFGSSCVEFRTYDGITIPFADSKFDVIVSFQVIEHIEDTASYLSEIARLLRSDGIALFTTPNAAIRLDKGMVPWNKFHVREYMADELKRLLCSTFSEISLRGLFAVNELYRVEFERCQSALQHARLKSRALRSMQRIIQHTSQRVLSMLKWALPASSIMRPRVLRSNSPGHTPNLANLSSIARFSTNDLFYSEMNLEKALDLFAICRNPNTAAAGHPTPTNGH